jgi:hypothetical protein
MGLALECKRLLKHRRRVLDAASGSGGGLAGRSETPDLEVGRQAGRVLGRRGNGIEVR